MMLNCKILGLQPCPGCVRSAIIYKDIPEDLLLGVSGWDCMCDEIDKLLTQYPDDARYILLKLLNDSINNERYTTDDVKRCLRAVLGSEKYKGEQNMNKLLALF